MTRLGCCCLVSLALAACDGLTDDRYRGEVLFSLDGTVETHGATSIPPDLRLMIAWPLEEGPTKFLIEPIEVFPTSPLSFRVDVTAAPPTEHDLVYSYGVIVATTSDYELHQGTPRGSYWGEFGVYGRGVLGFDPHHYVMYLPRDWDRRQWGTDTGPDAIISAGFHILDLDCVQCPGEIDRRRLDFFATPADLETELTVELFDVSQPYPYDSCRPDPYDRCRPRP